MNRTLLILCFNLISMLVAFAQADIGIAFNSVHIGRNLSVVGSKKINKHAILGGIKYGINSFESDDQNLLFKKRFFATNLIEHWGVIIGYQYFLKAQKSYLEPFFYYELQYTNSQTRNRSFFPVGYDVDNNVLYREDLDFFGPTIALENYLGFGLNIRINDFFLIVQKAGVGMINFQNTDKRYYFNNNSTWEFGYMLSFGMAYRLKEKKE